MRVGLYANTRQGVTLSVVEGSLKGVLKTIEKQNPLVG